MTMARPIGVTTLSLLETLGGIALALMGLFGLMGGGILALRGAGVVAFGVLAGTAFVAVGVAFVYMGVSLFFLRDWARWVTVILACGALGFATRKTWEVVAAHGEAILTLWWVAGCIFSGLAIVYLWRLGSQFSHNSPIEQPGGHGQPHPG
jgi:hypothetical protein